jgi:hypothetical protein
MSVTYAPHHPVLHLCGFGVFGTSGTSSLKSSPLLLPLPLLLLLLLLLLYPSLQGQVCWADCHSPSSWLPVWQE